MISSNPNKTSIEIKKKRLLFTQTTRLKAILQLTQPHNCEVAIGFLCRCGSPCLPLQVSPALPCTVRSRLCYLPEQLVALQSLMPQKLLVYYPDDSAALGSAVDAQ